MNYIKTKITCRDGLSDYQVDTNGVIYSKKNLPLKYSIGPNGYKTVCFMRYGKIYAAAVHRIVAEQFILNRYKKATVNHIDGNKRNNRVDNLEWATHEEQMKHVVALKLNPSNKVKRVIGINERAGEKKVFASMSIAADYIGCTRSCIWRVTSGNRKTVKGWTFKYL